MFTQSVYVSLKKSSLKNTFTICQKTSVCRTQDWIFSILNLGGFRLLLAIFIVRESKKQHFYPGDKKIYTSIFLKIHVHILIVMLRIFLALIVLGNKLHHHLDDQNFIMPISYYIDCRTSTYKHVKCGFQILMEKFAP